MSHRDDSYSEGDRVRIRDGISPVAGKTGRVIDPCWEVGLNGAPRRVEVALDDDGGLFAFLPSELERP